MTTWKGQRRSRNRGCSTSSTHDGRGRKVEGFLAQVLQRRRNHDTFNLIRVDVTARPDLAERFKVTTTPAVYVVQDKKVVARAMQPGGCAALHELLEPWLR